MKALLKAETPPVVDQVQPAQGSIVTPPDLGPVDPSTGQLVEVIKNGSKGEMQIPDTELPPIVEVESPNSGDKDD